MSHTRRDQKHFSVSQVAADWHELMIPQRIMRPSIARSVNSYPQFAASRHTTAAISQIRPHRHRLAAYHNKHCWRPFRRYQHQWP